MGNLISFKKALDSGIVVLSKAQNSKCQKNDIKKVWYSNQARDPNPQFINDVGESVFYLRKNQLRILK